MPLNPRAFGPAAPGGRDTMQRVVPMPPRLTGFNRLSLPEPEPETPAERLDARPRQDVAVSIFPEQAEAAERSLLSLATAGAPQGTEGAAEGIETTLPSAPSLTPRQEAAQAPPRRVGLSRLNPEDFESGPDPNVRLAQQAFRGLRGALEAGRGLGPGTGAQGGLTGLLQDPAILRSLGLDLSGMMSPGGLDATGGGFRLLGAEEAAAAPVPNAADYSLGAGAGTTPSGLDTAATGTGATGVDALTQPIPGSESVSYAGVSPLGAAASGWNVYNTSQNERLTDEGKAVVSALQLGAAAAGPYAGFVNGLAALAAFLMRAPLPHEVREQMELGGTAQGVGAGYLPPLREASSEQELQQVLRNPKVAIALRAPGGASQEVGYHRDTPMALADLAAALEGGSTINARVQQGIEPGKLAPINAAVSRMIERQIRILAAAQAGVPEAVEYVAKLREQNQGLARLRAREPLAPTDPTWAVNERMLLEDPRRSRLDAYTRALAEQRRRDEQYGADVAQTMRFSSGGG